MDNLIFRKCPIKESVLKEAGFEFVEFSKYTGKPGTFTWREKQLSLKEIDIDGTLIKIQSRTNRKLSEDHVYSYITGMKDGNVFPGTALFLDNNHYLASDGAHTLTAAKRCGAKSIQGAYIFSPIDFEQARYISSIFNGRTNGVGEDLEAKLYDHANRYIRMQESLPKVPSQKDYAKSLRLSEGNFNLAVRVTLMRTQLSKDGVRVEKIDVTTLDKLHKIINVFPKETAEIAQVIADFKPTATEVANFVGNFCNAKTIPEKLEIMEKQKQRWKFNPKSRGRTRGSRKETVLREALSKLDKIAIEDSSKSQNIIKDPNVEPKVKNIFNWMKRHLAL